MRPLATVAVAAALVAASAGAGVAAYRWVGHDQSSLPQISAYALGHTTRVGPFFYCNVVDLNDCVRDEAEGVLRVDDRTPVQLSVPGAISDAPWRLLKVYEDERNTTTTMFRPGSHLAVTIPTTDAQRGRMVGVVVQLMTLVRDENNEVFDLPHAEWSVKLTRSGG